MSPEGGSPDRDERFRRRDRMTRSADFVRCYRKGRRVRGRSANLHVHSNDRSHARLGITASRKIGGSVVRHLAKRRVREIFRRYIDREAVAGFDVVVHLHPGCGKMPFDEFREEIVGLFEEVARRRPHAERRADRGSGVRRAPAERRST